MSFDFDQKVSDLCFERAQEGHDPQYLLLDKQNYFELKLYVYKDDELAILEEVEEFQGLKVFYNNSESPYFDVI